METLCGNCEESVFEGDKAMACGFCNKWFHIKCVSLTEANYKKFQNNPQAFWFCPEDVPTIHSLIAEKRITVRVEECMRKEFQDIRDELREVKEEARKKMSFAEVAKLSVSNAETKVSIQQPRIDRSNGVILRPKSGVVLEENVVNIVKSKVNLVKIGAGVSSIKPFRSGGCFLGTISKTASEKLEKEITLQLGDKFEVSKPTTILPQLIISGVEKEYDENQLIAEITKTNPGFCEEDNFKLVHKKLVKSRESEKWMYVIEPGEQTYKKMENRYIMVDFKHHFVREYLNVTRCYNCQRYKHKATSCAATTICAVCSKNHSTRDCQESRNLKCINCMDANQNGANYKVNHKCGAMECKFHQKMLEEYRSKISFPQW